LTQPKYQYVIVDEFQDISQSRASLIRAVLEANPDARLFSVGDDWQSIYRFTGSDLTLMTDFENAFGKANRMDLTRAFRFSQECLDASSLFIKQNPRQLTKDLKANYTAERPTITIINDSHRAFEKACLKLSIEPKEILLLKRYSFSELPWINSKKSSELTVHGSKGLEADYVILIDLEASTYGFPSQIEDDPVLRLLFPVDEDYPDGEERRLFYVALTRAKRHTFLIAPSNVPPSGFLDELLQPEYANLIDDQSRLEKAVKCQVCECGNLVRRINKQNGELFFSCEFYPVCDGTGETCPQCEDQILDFKTGACLNLDCDYVAKKCSECKKGILVERTNSRTGNRFLACSQWANTGCFQTQQLPAAAGIDTCPNPDCKDVLRVGTTFCGKCGTDIEAWKNVEELLPREKERGTFVKVEEATEECKKALDTFPDHEEASGLVNKFESLKIKSFAFDRKETFACGGQKNTVKIYCHEKTGLEFVLVPGGSFDMGSNSDDTEKPVHHVIIKPFLLCRAAVTQQAWDRIGGDDNREWEGDDFPIEGVTWYECVGWAQKTGMRLPSEAEWEYACRAGTTTRFCFGDSDSELDEYAWYYDNAKGKIHSVGRKKPNAFGLFDMHGNVWEWCSDKWHDNLNGAPTDGSSWESATSSLRVVRGGCWYYLSGFCRSACRIRNVPGRRWPFLGFRPAFSLPSND